MRCAVCGGRGTHSKDFVLLWRITDKGEKIGGKPVYAHVGCSHKLVGYMEATIAKSTPGKMLKRVTEKVSDKLNFLKKLPRILRKDKKPAYSPKNAQVMSEAETLTERQERRKQERDARRAERKANKGRQ